MKNNTTPLKRQLIPLILAILALTLQSCSHAVKPDLKRLYEQNRMVKQPPVVLIHGMMGSRLTDSNTDKEVWVGKLSSLLFSNYEEIALEIDPESLLPKPSPLVTSGLLDTVIGQDFYAGITDTLNSAGNYQYANIGEDQLPTARNYYVFTYDWRQDNVQTVRALSRFIEQIRLDLRIPS